MLPQTKQCVAALKDAGLTRAQFRIRTPWKYSAHDYAEPHIDIVCSFVQIAPYVQKLAKSFKVVVTLFDGVPRSVALTTSQEVGLYRLEHGREKLVKEIVFHSSFQQLPLWDTS